MSWSSRLRTFPPMYILAASRIVATATSGPRTHSQGKRQLCRRWERARRGDAPRSNALTLLTELLGSILPAFPSVLLPPPQSFADQQDSRETLSQASGVLPHFSRKCLSRCLALSSWASASAAGGSTSSGSAGTGTPHSSATRRKTAGRPRLIFTQRSTRPCFRCARGEGRTSSIRCGPTAHLSSDICSSEILRLCVCEHRKSSESSTRTL